MVAFSAAPRRLEFAKTTSLDNMLQNWTLELHVLFRSRGYGIDVAEDMAQRVIAELSVSVRDVLAGHDSGVASEPREIAIGNLKLDLERRLFWRDNEEVHLTPKEWDLLALLMRNAGRLVTHVKLLRSVWGIEYGGELEYLRTCVCALRKKIERNPSIPEYIFSEPWIGYRFRSPGEAPLAVRSDHDPFVRH
jgi:DNA-binding winged helix-turn-helix (wHTH) protein